MHLEHVRSRQGLSTIAAILIGLTLAFFTTVSILAVRHLVTTWKPTIANAERLLGARKYGEALELAKKIEVTGPKATEIEILQGKIWLLRAWEKLDKENWRGYGENDQDWFTGPYVDKAEAHFKAAVEQSPRNPDAHYHLGILYMEKGWYRTAESEFLDVLTTDPDHLFGRINLAVIYTKLAQYDRAERELREAFALDPTSPAVAKNMALLFRYHVNQPDSAIVWANRYLNLDPDADLEAALIKSDLIRLLERYPDVALEEKPQWKNEPRFRPRG